MNARHPDEEAARKRQIEIYRRMTPEQRIRTAMRLYSTARQIKAAALRAAHPDWDERRIAEEVREAFLYARS
jgi:hypothetical protein